jgi:hypothetical protein
MSFSIRGAEPGKGRDKNFLMGPGKNLAQSALRSEFHRRPELGEPLPEKSIS